MGNLFSGKEEGVSLNGTRAIAEHLKQQRVSNATFGVTMVVVLAGLGLLACAIPLVFVLRIFVARELTKVQQRKRAKKALENAALDRKRRAKESGSKRTKRPPPKKGEDQDAAATAQAAVEQQLDSLHIPHGHVHAQAQAQAAGGVHTPNPLSGLDRTPTLDQTPPIGAAGGMLNV